MGAKRPIRLVMYINLNCADFNFAVICNMMPSSRDIDNNVVGIVITSLNFNL